jgi:hypothetical protein
VAIPGAMNAGLAGFRWMIGRGLGHAKVHARHQH